MEINKCDICDAILTDTENHFRSVLSYRKVCDKHEAYHNYATPKIILQKKLGLVNEYPAELKCNVCNCNLTETEKQALTDDCARITCAKHAEVKTWHQDDHCVLWFKFKEANPKAVYVYSNNESKPVLTELKTWNIKYYEWIDSLSNKEYTNIVENYFKK